MEGSGHISLLSFAFFQEDIQSLWQTRILRVIWLEKV